MKNFEELKEIFFREISDDIGRPGVVAQLKGEILFTDLPKNPNFLFYFGRRYGGVPGHLLCRLVDSYATEMAIQNSSSWKERVLEGMREPSSEPTSVEIEDDKIRRPRFTEGEERQMRAIRSRKDLHELAKSSGRSVQSIQNKMRSLGLSLDFDKFAANAGELEKENLRLSEEVENLKKSLKEKDDEIVKLKSSLQDRDKFEDNLRWRNEETVKRLNSKIQQQDLQLKQLKMFFIAAQERAAAEEQMKQLAELISKNAFIKL